MLNSDFLIFYFVSVYLIVPRTDIFFFNLLFISCSYIGGNESEGHFSLINEACSMLVRPGKFQLNFYVYYHRNF